MLKVRHDARLAGAFQALYDGWTEFTSEKREDMYKLCIRENLLT